MLLQRIPQIRFWGDVADGKQSHLFVREFNSQIAHPLCGSSLSGIVTDPRKPHCRACESLLGNTPLGWDIPVDGEPIYENWELNPNGNGWVKSS